MQFIVIGKNYLNFVAEIKHSKCFYEFTLYKTIVNSCMLKLAECIPNYPILVSRLDNVRL